MNSPPVLFYFYFCRLPYCRINSTKSSKSQSGTWSSVTVYKLAFLNIQLCIKDDICILCNIIHTVWIDCIVCLVWLTFVSSFFLSLGWIGLRRVRLALSGTVTAGPAPYQCMKWTFQTSVYTEIPWSPSRLIQLFSSFYYHSFSMSRCNYVF